MTLPVQSDHAAGMPRTAGAEPLARVAPGAQVALGDRLDRAAIQLGMEGLGDVSDLHIHVTDVKRSVLFPGPRPVPLEALPLVRDLVAACDRVGKLDFMVCYREVCWRGRRDLLAVDGVWLRLRRMPAAAPTLDALPSPMAESVRQLMLAPSLARGGLVYVVGSPGSGKTTTASAMLVSRLHAFGGYAYTVEDPPEMPLNGWHGPGYCAQAWVPGERVADWMEAMRGALRSQPSGTSCILYLGEARDPESARAMLRAASNGFLVIATGFGQDITAGLDALVQLAGAEVLATLSSVLRLVVHQRLIDGLLAASVLASAGPNSEVALRLRAGQLSHLAGDVQRQANQMRVGVNPLTPTAA